VVTVQREQLTIGEAARLIGCSVQHVRTLANAGRLPCQVTPLGRLFAITDVAAFVAERERRQRERVKVRQVRTGG
jgi:excisionase family DNA binding protein